MRWLGLLYILYPIEVYPYRIIRLHGFYVLPPQESLHGDNTVEGTGLNLGEDPNPRWYLPEPLSLQLALEVPEAQVSLEFRWALQLQLVLFLLENPKAQ